MVSDEEASRTAGGEMDGQRWLDSVLGPGAGLARDGGVVGRGAQGIAGASGEVSGGGVAVSEVRAACWRYDTRKRKWRDLGKEEAAKARQLRHRFGPSVQFVLFLGGYFDSGYLGYEAAEGIDWVWEHRIEDFTELGL